MMEFALFLLLLTAAIAAAWVGDHFVAIIFVVGAFLAFVAWRISRGRR